MKLSSLTFAVVWSAALLAVPMAAQDTTAQGVRIGLSYDRSGKPGIAFTAISGANADSVRAILLRDLDFSDRVTVIPPDSGPGPSGLLNYELFAKLNAVAIIQASVTPSGALHVAVHEVSQQRVVSVMDFPLPTPLSPEWRHVVHVAADSVEFAVLGQKGIASTRILFSRGNQIWMVDSDGANARIIPGTAGGLSPAWHPSGTAFAYGAIRVSDAPPRIVVRDLDGTRTSVKRVGGTNMSPTFSPDGSTLVFAAGSDGLDLYAASPFADDAPRRLTVRRSANTSPTFSPDGLRIAFTSGLIGHPEVYIMDADGSNPDLLTSSGFGERLYRSNPDWSPNGRRVAYQSQVNDVFQIMTISVTDKTTSQLTSEGANEDPSWAPDGRHVVFVSTRYGTPQLFVLDTESSRIRQITHGARAQNPAWSPRLQVPRQSLSRK